MSHVSYAHLALHDLRDIRAYIASDSIDSADRFVDLIQEKCQLLADTPGIGRVHEEVAPDLHFFPVGRYMIAYHTTDAGIRVVRVIHAARDFPTFFR